MDYVDVKDGHQSSNFYFRGKKTLVDALMHRATSFCRENNSQINQTNKRLRILNLGAGTGHDLEVLNKYGKVYVVDINRKALDLIDESLCYDKRIADACKLPFKSNFFDIVVSFDVFEHIRKHQKAASEAHRVLKPGGVLVFSVPAYSFLFSSHDIALGHERRYSMNAIKSLLRGFSKVHAGYWNVLLFTPIALLRLARKTKNTEQSSTDPMHKVGILNPLLCLVLETEAGMIKKGFRFPFGITIAGVAVKG